MAHVGSKNAGLKVPDRQHTPQPTEQTSLLGHDSLYKTISVRQAISVTH